MGQSTSHLPYYTYAEIAKHRTKESAWLVINGLVYDVTSYIGCHPGGNDSLLMRAGGFEDCERDFNFHPTHAKKMWKQYLIGNVDETSRRVKKPAKAPPPPSPEKDLGEGTPAE